MTADMDPIVPEAPSKQEAGGTSVEQETEIELLSSEICSMGCVQAEMDREMARVQVSLQDIAVRQRRASVVRFAIAGSMLLTTALLIIMLTPAAGLPLVRVFAVVAVVFQIVVVACSASGMRM